MPVPITDAERTELAELRDALGNRALADEERGRLRELEHREAVTDEGLAEADELLGSDVEPDLLEPKAQDDAIRLPDAKLARLLELNGFNAIRSEVLGTVGALERIPLEAFEAGIAYSRQAVGRLKVDPHPQAAEALANAERELAVFEAARRMRRDLKALGERLEARERITAR